MVILSVTLLFLTYSSRRSVPITDTVHTEEYNTEENSISAEEKCIDGEIWVPAGATTCICEDDDCCDDEWMMKKYDPNTGEVEKCEQ